MWDELIAKQGWDTRFRCGSWVGNCCLFELARTATRDDASRSIIPRERTGTVGLTLLPVSGITINNVHFVVSQGGAMISEGDLPTPGMLG